VLAPIALFAYRRPDHTRRTLESLRACKELADSPLHIYCDGPKPADALADIRETRRIARSLAPSATFIERDTNLGLARSIIAGTTELTERHGKVIVVEDDLEVAPSFLRFINAGLDRYAGDDRVMQVSGYQFPVTLAPRALFLPFPTSWGWGTWARAWRRFDPDATGHAALAADPALRREFDLDGSYPYFAMLERHRRGEIDSWAIRWYLSVFMHHGLTLFPGKSLVRNTGFDGSGTHGTAGSRYADDAFTHVDDRGPELPEVVLDVESRRRIASFLAEQTGRDRRKRVKDFAVQRIKSVLSNPRVPASLRAAGTNLLARVTGGGDGGTQDLDIYWDPKMAALLETWGIGNAWNEIQLLLVNVRGSVLDIACGTGKVMTLLEPYKQLEVHGFDISDFLIQKAIDRGIPRDRLKIADATKTGYADKQFDYGYSIGSLEHFTEDGILEFVAETRRIIGRASFHQIPTSRSGKNHGWIKMLQSYHNNSVPWWLERFHSAYKTVHVFDSAWNDKISVGKWFVCVEDS
jgi:hypothetical protein